MNFAVDDADPSISYSPNGWDVQSANDPDLDKFFQETYHVAAQDGATMVFQFIGSAFALYGSKGPQHAQFNLQYDNIVVPLDASASTTAFQQELFSHSFASDGNATQHTVKVTAILNGMNNWLDIDYITFTNGNGTTSSIQTATTNPPWLSGSSQPTQTGTANSTGPNGFPVPSSASSHSSQSKVSTILAIVFGSLIGVAILAGLAWLLIRRIYAQRRARERAFRYGQSSVNPSSTAGYYAASAKSGVPTTTTRPLSPPTSTMREYQSPMGAYTLVEHGEGSLASGQGHAPVELRNMSLDHREREQERERERGPGTGSTTPSTSRPLLSQSPIAWTTRKIGGHKGDADSLRTDFLQV
ncbi:hypothetical protein BD311DRAFT_273946 [Dichomitus squalens]|uniref:Uncharacterized protein n=1 Tax=Dichomitus squalens TaxID=114155 RepID=A0A4Q9MNE2_9APHY|nr:hypothetical protein BD311DRAFT_273946 [Dichomitus squalens]